MSLRDPHASAVHVRPVSGLPFAAWPFSAWPYAAWPIGGVLAVCLFCLVFAGCTPKKLTADELPLEATSAEERASIHLPADDGKPLSPEELDALISVGDFDRNVRGDDMREVILHFKFYMHQARRTVERNVERGEIYLPHIRSVLKQKRLPGELAYLPFIESGYNTQAKSRTGALGMWQFVKGTGKYYGMKRDWWSDERYDPYQSTDAAAEYLGKLNGMFDDWHLAITAYNAGEGRVSRAMSASGAKNFFDLRRRNNSVPDKDRLTEENQQYLPRFLAVCKIMRNLEALGFRAPSASKSREVAEITVRPGSDLLALAKGLGMSWSEFSTYNPAFLRYISPPDRSASVYVPRSMSAQARTLASRSGDGGGWRTHTVRKGDTIARIASRNGVPVAELRRVNQVSEPLKPGKVIRIPGTDGSAAPRVLAEAEPERAVARGSSRDKEDADEYGPSGRIHVIKSGDTLFGLSRSWGVPMAAVAEVNKLKSDTLAVGQKLNIPDLAQTTAPHSEPQETESARSIPKTVAGKDAGTRTATAGKTVVAPRASKAEPTKPAVKSAEKKKPTTYTVQPGDTVWAIARKFDIPPDELLRANNMTRDVRLRPGDRVVLN